MSARSWCSSTTSRIFLKKNVALQINFCFWRKKNLFLGVYKRREKFKYLVKKRVHRQNKVIRGLLVCIIQKFNGYDVIKKSLEKKEKKDFEPLNIVYELVMDNSRIKCFYTDKSYIAFRSFIDRKKRESIGSNILQPGSFATAVITLIVQRMNLWNTQKDERLEKGLFIALKMTKLFLSRTILDKWEMFLLPFILTLKLPRAMTFLKTQKCLW